MKASLIITLLTSLAPCEKSPAQSPAAPTLELESLSAAQKARLIVLFAQGLEALGAIHEHGHSFEGTQYWIVVIRSTVLEADARFTKEAQALIAKYNQLALSTVQKLEQSWEKRAGISSAQAIVNQFQRQVESMIETNPEYAQFFAQSQLSQAFGDISIVPIVEEAEHERKAKNLEGKALGEHFRETAEKIRALL